MSHAMNKAPKQERAANGVGSGALFGTSWAKMPSGGGYFWRKVTLRDGTVYACCIEWVYPLWGNLYHSDERLKPICSAPIREMELVTWSGPLFPPA